MMEVKLVEIRDHGTLIPALAVRLAPETVRQAELLGWSGFGPSGGPYVLLHSLQGSEMNYDPYSWPREPLRSAHRWIIQNFDSMEACSVVDARFVRGEQASPCVSDLETKIDRQL